ncbi:MAG: NAD(P)/FAD-dependent oxidoreductase [Candidatus Nanohaloarchaeota archaeon QJJ-7]|nr:NAD(P)/FAD-dependent oxidoreductase [Candidatus Nanohaloarchaeota archaeon QJJ-7]
MDRHDIAVVGAGPAGLQYARELADEYDVAIYEKDSDITDRKKSTGGTFPEMMDEFNIPESLAMAETDEVVFVSPDSRSRLNVDGFVLEYGDFLEYISEEAQNHGAELNLDSNVTGYDTDTKGAINSINVDGEKVEADLFVDASGPEAVIAQDYLGLNPNEDDRWIGVEQELRGGYYDGQMVFEFGDVAPGGYAWAFDAGENTKVGVCWSKEFFRKQDGEGTLQDYLQDWIAQLELENNSVEEVHAGSAFSYPFDVDRSDDRFLAVGDTVASINPLLLEGIRPGMQSARYAAEITYDAMEQSDLSARKLRGYDQKWAEEKGKSFRKQKLAQELVYQLNEERLNQFVEKVDELDENLVEDFVHYDLNLRDMWQIYPSIKGRDLARVGRFISK